MNSEKDYALALKLYAKQKPQVVSLEGSTGLALACVREQRPTMFGTSALQKQVVQIWIGGAGAGHPDPKTPPMTPKSSPSLRPYHKSPTLSGSILSVLVIKALLFGVILGVCIISVLLFGVYLGCPYHKCTLVGVYLGCHYHQSPTIWGLYYGP